MGRSKRATTKPEEIRDEAPPAGAATAVAEPVAAPVAPPPEVVHVSEPPVVEPPAPRPAVTRALEIDEISFTDELRPVDLAALEAAAVLSRARPRSIEMQLEALLFSTNVPLTKGEIAAILAAPVSEVEEALRALERTLTQRSSSIELFSRPKGRAKKKEGGRAESLAPAGEEELGYILDLKPVFRGDVAPLVPPSLKPAVTETLALIALNQPIFQRRLVAERGTGVYDHVKELLERRLIQRQRRGPNYVLRTTDAFAAEFGLPNDADAIRVALAKAAGMVGAPDAVGSPRVWLGEGPPPPVAVETPPVDATTTPAPVEDCLVPVDEPAPAEPVEDCLVPVDEPPVTSPAVDAIATVAPAVEAPAVVETPAAVAPAIETPHVVDTATPAATEAPAAGRKKKKKGEAVETPAAVAPTPAPLAPVAPPPEAAPAIAAPVIDAGILSAFDALGSGGGEW